MRAIVIVSALLFLCDCRYARQKTYQSKFELDVDLATPRADRLWEAIQDELRGNGFTLNRVDRRNGVITTQPVTSQHFFEIWRHDVDTATDFLDASLNPVRRWVEVRYDSNSEAERNMLQVIVHKERLSSPGRQVGGAAAAHQYFAEGLTSAVRASSDSKGGDRWVDQGRDAAREDCLARRILVRAGLGS